MATAAVQLDEEAFIRGEIEKLILPKGVWFRKLEAGQDWDGDPDWNIYFAVSKKIPLTKKRLSEISRMKTDLMRTLIDAGIAGFPRVRLLDAR